MSAESVAEALQALAELPPGRAKASRLESLAEEAAAAGDHHLEARVLVELSQAYEYGAEGEKLPLALGRLLRLVDRYPAELGGRLSHTIHWQLKWMTTGMIVNPAVPLATVGHWLDEFEGRYQQRGYSLRPVHAARAELALLFGDKAAAAAAMEKSITAPRDQMSDCEACERGAWGRWRTAFDDDGGALAHWEPVLEGQLACLEEPHRVLGYALLPLVRTGRLDDARAAFLRGYPMAKGNVSLLGAVARHAEFCALTGNEARGLEILAAHTAWLTDTQLDAARRSDFVEGVTVLLRRLSVLGHGELPVGPHTVASLLASYEAELASLCALFDRRNGTSAFSGKVAARLARPPLVDALPLGLPVTLPPAAAPVPAVAGSAGSETLSGLIARAEELDTARHPAADQAWAAVAAVGGAAGEGLPPGVAGRVAEVAALKLLPDNPALARKSFLDLADSFAERQDRVAELRVRASAARALAVSGQHALARAEATELTSAAEAAFAVGDLTARHYLAVRVSEQIIALHAVDVAQHRTPAEIDAVVAGLANTLAVIERYGDQHHIGRCHDLLAQVGFWRQDRDETTRHLQAARDAYFAAQEPWFAAQPCAALAEFALQAGDAAAASGYAGEALRYGVDFEPDRAAMLASLRVEALTRQPGKALELADAALSAAARWEGISEPDTLHNTFNAARAYLSLGRHAEAAALFAEAMPRVAVPYDAAGIAMTREQYARALRAIGQPAEAAAQFLQAAQALDGDQDNVAAQASLAAAAAESLRKSGQDEAALAAFRRAAELFGSVADRVNRVRCLRSAAWIVFFSTPSSADGGGGGDVHADAPGSGSGLVAASAAGRLDRVGERAGIAAMRAVLAELEPLVVGDSPAALATELASTRSQLAEMVNEGAAPGSA